MISQPLSSIRQSWTAFYALHCQSLSVEFLNILARMIEVCLSNALDSRRRSLTQVWKAKAMEVQGDHHAKSEALTLTVHATDSLIGRWILIIKEIHFFPHMPVTTQRSPTQKTKVLNDKVLSNTGSLLPYSNALEHEHDKCCRCLASSHIWTQNCA